MRRTVHRVLENAKDDDLGSRVVDILLISLISLSVVAVILESMPGFEARHADGLALFEALTVAVFSVEYLLRVWSSVERSGTGAHHPIRQRLRYVFSFYAIIDLISILPFYLVMFYSFHAIDMRFLRAVRLLRVLKLTRYSTAMNMLLTTIRENSRALTAAFVILLTIMLLAASGMYYFERESQPQDFGSIPAAMWWSFATLTTVGYGDVTPITVGGKIFGALITVVGIGMVALPTSILASGYTRQLRLNAAIFEGKADIALDDGVITDDEFRSLESLRVDLGISEHTASQILDARRVQSALRHAVTANTCPACGQRLPADD